MIVIELSNDLFSDFFRLVDIILEKMSDAPEDPSGSNNANYGNSSSYNKGTTRLAANEQQSKMGNQCQC